MIGAPWEAAGEKRHEFPLFGEYSRFTDDHPDGIAGAQAVALAVHLARQGAGKDDIRREVAARVGYDLDRTLAGIRPGYSFDVAARNSVPEAILCFLEAADFEDAVRNA